MFELISRDGMGRTGLLHTKHGNIETPILLPVINPNQMIITPLELEELFGIKMLITNSYIIHKTENLRKEAVDHGVHNLLNFHGAIMTDSGTFQSHVYGDVEVDPKEIVNFQKEIGSDVGTILDVFSEPDHDEERVAEDVKETVRRAKEASEIKDDMALACTVQGGTFPYLRRKCAEELSKINCEIHPIGGVVPIMESYRFRDMVDVIIASKMGLTPARPVHLFGAGHPIFLGMAVLLGCDIFDSASYAKFAKDGRMLFFDGTRKLEEIMELPCSCPVCSKHSLEDLIEMNKEGDYKALAMHNLYVNFTEIKSIKQAIYEGNLWEYVEERCRVHPNLLSALKHLSHHKSYMERFEPISKKSAFFYTGSTSIHRPIVYRYEKRFFERYQHPKLRVQIGFDEGNRPYSKFYEKEIAKISRICDAHFIVNSVFGPVPIELDGMYPIAQSIIPEDLDFEALERMRRLMERHSHRGLFQLAVMWDGDETLQFLEGMGRAGAFDIDMERVKSVADMQFGKGAASILVKGNVELIKSKKTGKIRNVLSDNKHVLSMRASDGMFTLKKDGATRLHGGFKPPRMRVAVEDDSVGFNRKGKNVFAKFVVECDEEIRPMDEVLVVDKNDALVAFGRAMMNREEMLSFKIGVAVKVREGISTEKNSS